MRKLLFVFALLFVVLLIDAVCFSRSDALPPASKLTPLPPTYISGVVIYDERKRFKGMVLGSTRFTSCRDALDDSQSAIVKAAELAPPGSITEGICIPVHTYSVADLIPTGQVDAIPLPR